MIRIHLVLMLGLGLAAVATNAAAGDHNRARQLRHKGEVLPLAQILERMPPRYAGRVLEVELKQRHGRTVYEIERLGRDGVVREITVDAGSGEVLHVEMD